MIRSRDYGTRSGGEPDTGPMAGPTNRTRCLLDPAIRGPGLAGSIGRVLEDPAGANDVERNTERHGELAGRTAGTGGDVVSGSEGGRRSARLRVARADDAEAAVQAARRGAQGRRSGRDRSAEGRL